jgi:glutaredoxin-related protein
MLKIYGSMLCKDCVQCREDLDNAGISYDYLDFKDDLKNLKEFLALRDSLDIFQSAKENGIIGIPCIVDDEGNVCLDWEQYL